MFDLVIVIILIVAIVKGFKNGFVIELAALVGLVLGVLGAIYFSYLAEEWLSKYWDFKYIGAVAFLITFLVISIGINLLAKLVTEMIKLAALNFINRLVGGVFSMLKYAFIISVLMSVFSFFNWEKYYIGSEQKEESRLYKPLSLFAPSIFPYLNFDDAHELLNNESAKGVII